MDDTPRRYRVMPVHEDAGERGYVRTGPWALSEPEPLEVEMRETWPDWRCWACGSPNVGWFVDCGYCGHDREDIDQCE